MNNQKYEQAMSFIYSFQEIEKRGETLLSFYNPGLAILLILLGIYIAVCLYREKKGVKKDTFSIETAVTFLILYHLIFLILILWQTLQIATWKEQVKDDFIYEMKPVEMPVDYFSPIDGRKSKEFLTKPFVEEKGGLDKFEKIKLTGKKEGKKITKELTVIIIESKKVKKPLLVYKKLQGPILTKKLSRNYHSEEMFKQGYYDAVLYIPKTELN